MVGALSLDVGGVLLHLRRPVAETYQRLTGSQRSQAHSHSLAHGAHAGAGRGAPIIGTPPPP